MKKRNTKAKSSKKKTPRVKKKTRTRVSGTRKAKLVQVKGRSRKKSVAVHASKVHGIKQQLKPATSCRPSGGGSTESVGKESLFAKAKRVHSFSFPMALSQVRTTVEQEKPPVVEKKAIRRNKSIKIEGESEHEMSPYVLDLRAQKTVLPGVIKATPKKKANKKDSKQSSLLSLFETTTLSKEKGLFKRTIKSFGQQFTAEKKINFAPIENKFEPGLFFKKIGRSLAWRRYYAQKKFKDFRTSQNNKRLQRTFALPKGVGKKRADLMITHSTRSGKAIKAKTIKELFPTSAQRYAAHRRKQKYEIKELQKELFGNPLVNTRRMAFSFAGLCLLIILPMGLLSLGEYVSTAKQQVLGATSLALNQLQAAQLDVARLEFPQAAEDFQEAGQAFQAVAALIQSQYSTVSKVVSILPVVGKKLEAAQNVLSAGENLSKAAVQMSQAVEVLTNENHFLADQELSYKVQYIFVRLQEAIPYVKQANETLEKVDVSQLPDDFASQVEEIKAILPTLEKSLDQVDVLSEAILTLIGHDSMQRYLVVFQNNTELRATGGFMGSLALVDMDRGEISKIEIPGGGPYQYQGSLLDYYVAPRALQLINPRWELQDANWFFDWPTSAQKISRFYEKAGGPSVDGVIAIDTQVLQALLQLVGPVYLDDYGFELSAENFRDLLHEEVEQNYDQELNQPKKVIADLAPILLESIKNMKPEQYLDLGRELGDLLLSRDVLLFHNELKTQASFSKLGWSGEIVQPEADYLAVVHTNLAGGKTDGVIQDKMDLSIYIDEKGEKVNTLTISRTHNGEKGAFLTGVRNVDYLRVYVPEGSTLIEASGFKLPPAQLFKAPGEKWLRDEDLLASEGQYQVDELSKTEIYKESSKTVFANWIQVDPGETVEVKLVYKSGFPIQVYDVPVKGRSWTDWLSGKKSDPVQHLYFYDLYWQKQSGSWDPEIGITLNFPQQWQVKGASDFVTESGPGTWKSQAVMAGDSYWSWLMY